MVRKGLDHQAGMNHYPLGIQNNRFSAMSVIIETTEGAMTVDLLTDSCPTTCLNFLKLCKIKYYNNCLFFNVQQNFIAQTGDPTGGEMRLLLIV